MRPRSCGTTVLPADFPRGNGLAAVANGDQRLVGELAARYKLIFVAGATTIMPMLVFYLFAQKQLIKGFSGGIRG